MDKRVYLLTIVSFIVGMVELIIGGILDLVATDLNITIGQAGRLITIFSFVFAITGPVLLYVTARVERTKLTILSLIVFFFGNLLALFSTTYGVLILSRVVTAASGSLLTVLCITLAANIVKPHYRGRAIGLVVMGISGSIVLGVPIGILLGHSFGWRAPFLVIAILTIALMLSVYLFLGKVYSSPPVSLKKQIATLKSRSVLFAHFTTFFFLAGHFTLYGFLTPFSKTLLGFDGIAITVMYFLFGVAAVTGGGIGGFSADRYGSERTIITVTVLLGVTMFLIPYTTNILPVFFIALLIWGVMSWAITPPVQSYLIQVAPETSDIQQSLNNSALHFGIAFGTLIGSFVIERFSVEQNATFGSLFIVLSLLSILLAMCAQRQKTTTYEMKENIK